jgi:uncharacterized membrane protein
MIRSAQAVYFTALGLWVGGLVALAFFAAPMTFRHAPSRSIAGSIFGPTLRAFGYMEMVCAILVVASAAVLHRMDGAGAWTRGIRLALVLLMLLLVVTSTFGIAPAVAAEGQRVRHLEEGNPARARFDRLHRWSVRLVGANIVAGLALLAFSAAALRPGR